ncbi:amino acid ABC transporter permease [Nocardioides maradonensis]
MKRTTKRRLSTLALYAVFVAALVALALVANWQTIKFNFWNHDGVAFNKDSNWPDLITTGIVNTLKYTAIAFGGGLVIGVGMALMRQAPAAPYRWLATTYIEFFRGLPALLVMGFCSTGIPIAFGWHPPGGPVGAGLVGLILVASAYMAETMRAGIQAVPPGQVEAARSLGMSSVSTTLRIVLPQAFRIVVPPLTNEFVALIKDTALLSTAVGIELSQRELTSVANDFVNGGPSAGTSTSLIQAALLYLVITLPLTQTVAWLERRQRRAVR